MDAGAFFCPSPGHIRESANHLNCSASSLNVVQFLSPLQWASDLLVGINGAQCVSVWRSNLCLQCRLMHSPIALWPLPQNKWLCVYWLDLLWSSAIVVFQLLNQCALLIHLFPLWLILSTEHDTRVMAKERQKKDNHNLSKCPSLTSYLISENKL